MKIKTSVLLGTALDYTVAKCEEFSNPRFHITSLYVGVSVYNGFQNMDFKPSSD